MRRAAHRDDDPVMLAPGGKVFLRELSEVVAVVRQHHPLLADGVL